MNFDTPPLLYSYSSRMVVAPDLRDGRPPEEARQTKNANILSNKIVDYSPAPALLVACRPGGPAPLPSGYSKVVNTTKSVI